VMGISLRMKIPNEGFGKKHLGLFRDGTLIVFQFFGGPFWP
jgi:hypothetical protein